MPENKTKMPETRPITLGTSPINRVKSAEEEVVELRAKVEALEQDKVIMMGAIVEVAGLVLGGGQ